VPDGLDPCAVPGAVLDVYKLATREVSFSKERLNGAAADPDGETRFADDATGADIDPGTIGSNNWAISPAKSATGRPILANDPHRAHSVPSLRYIAHLSAPGVDVIGAGEPALPGISIGHNDRIAFGLTIFAIDQEDLYVYETNPANADEYRYQGRWEPMRIVREDLPVKGREPRRIEMKFTRHGPVVFEDAQNHRAYAVRAAWLEPGMAPYFGSIDYMRARDWDQFLAAMNRWGSPSENQAYADTEGNIAWVPGGLTPIRPNWDGLLPVPGDGRYEWAGFYDRDALPSEFNPARGWVGSANQMNLPPDYPYRERKIGFEWTDPSRFNRITEVLSGLPKVGIEDSKRLQMDYASLHARRLKALLAPLEAQQQDGRIAAALKLLTGWDATVGFDSPAAALYEVWFTRHLRPAVVAALAPQEARPLIEGGDTAVIVTLLEKPDQRFGADPAKARDAILLSSLGEAAAETEKLLGSDWRNWRWSNLHKALFQHALSPVLDDSARPEFDVGPLAKAGDGYTVSASTYRTRDFRLTAGASFRMVVDVGNWDASWAVNTPGQSGDPRSTHYRDLAEKWVSGEYFPLLYSREAVEQATEKRIVLTPE
jgi:penicillin G amidase